MSKGSQLAIRHALLAVRESLAPLELARQRLEAVRRSDKLPPEMTDVELDLTGCIKTLERDQRELSNLLTPATPSLS